MIWRRRFSLVLALCVFISTTAFSAEYVVTPLGTLGGTTSSAVAINAAGQIVGYSKVDANATHAFLYTNATMQDLGTLGGTNSYALGINSSGQVVGQSQIANGQTHAFLYSAGSMQDLGAILGSGLSYAYDINDSGQIVGQGTSQIDAYLYSGGSVIDLGGASKSVAYAINSQGQIVGEVYPSEHAFRYSATTLTDLGSITSASGYSIAHDINDSGVVVGEGLVGGHEHAFLFDTIMHDLGIGSVLAINNSGQAVGSIFPSPGISRGALFAADSSSGQDLNDLISSASNWTFLNGKSINDSGCIVGEGTNSNVNSGATQALLLVPVPEPSSLLVIFLGLAGLFNRSRRAAP